MAPSSQELEPPANPGRFSTRRRRTSKGLHARCSAKAVGIFARSICVPSPIGPRWSQENSVATMTRLYKWRFGKARFALLALGLLAFCALTAILLWEGRSPAEEAQKYYEHGAKLLEQRDYVKASIELRNPVRLKSDMLTAGHD